MGWVLLRPVRITETRRYVTPRGVTGGEGGFVPAPKARPAEGG